MVHSASLLPLVIKANNLLQNAIRGRQAKKKLLDTYNIKTPAAQKIQKAYKQRQTRGEARHELDKRRAGENIYNLATTPEERQAARNTYLDSYTSKLKSKLKPVQDSNSHLRTRTLKTYSDQIENAKTKTDFDELKTQLSTPRLQEALKNYTKGTKQAKTIKSLLGKNELSNVGRPKKEIQPKKK